MFSVHAMTRQEFKNVTITIYFGFLFEENKVRTPNDEGRQKRESPGTKLENHMTIVTSPFLKSSVFKMFFVQTKTKSRCVQISLI